MTGTFKILSVIEHSRRVESRLKKECKADGLKFQGSSKQVKFEEVFEYDEFQAIFGGKGVLIQPTPQNKPKSTVTIIEFVRLLSPDPAPYSASDARFFISVLLPR